MRMLALSSPPIGAATTVHYTARIPDDLKHGEWVGWPFDPTLADRSVPQLVDAHHLLRLRVAQDAIGSEREQRVARVDVATGQHEGRVVLVHGQAAQPAYEARLRALRRR